MDDPQPPHSGPPGGRALLLLLLLIAIATALVAWAYLRHPPGTPEPSRTATPDTVPGGDVGE